MIFDFDTVSAMGVLYVVLALASLIIRLLNKKHRHGQLCSQINSWWWILPMVSAALLFHPLGLVALAVLISMLAIRELSAHVDSSANQFRVLATALALFTIFYCYVHPARLFFPTAGCCALGLLFWAWRSRTALLWALLGLTVLCVCILIRLTSEGESPNAWLLFLFVVTALNDIGQFVFGQLLGKRKIAPYISPNKTWGGLWGGMAVSVCVSLSLGAWLELTGLVTLFITAIILALAGFLGDILFSSAKRFMGIKDFSDLIPGHGGILDRIDSLTVTAPVLYGLLLILY